MNILIDSMNIKMIKSGTIVDFMHNKPNRVSRNSNIDYYAYLAGSFLSKKYAVIGRDIIDQIDEETKRKFPMLCIAAY